MSLLENIAPAPRKVMTLFYLIDSSGSMQGTRIGTVNSAMEECVPMLRDVAQANDDAEIKVAVLEFSNGCNWITPESGPVNIDDLHWNDLKAGGITDFGSALRELDKKLSRNEYLKSQTGAYAPVIILLSDGEPTDDWESALNQIKNNNWFKYAIKIAIDIEGDSNKDVLTAFTGNIEAILEAKDKSALKKMIHKVSVRASEFQSHSKQASDETTTPEKDSADIVHDVIADINMEESSNGISDSDDNWDDWG